MVADHNKVKKTANGIFWTIVGQGSSLVRFASTLVLARLLAPEDFGVIAIAVSIVSLGHLLKDWGWHQAIIQRYEITDEELSSIFWLIALSSLFISIALLLLSSYFGRFYNQSQLPYIIALLIVDLWLRSSFQVPDALLRREMNFKVHAVADLSGGLVGGFAGIAAALMGAGVYSLAIRIVLNSAVLMTILWHTVTWRPKLIFGLKYLRSYASFGIPIFTIGMVGLARSQAEPIIIGKWFSANDLGIYSMAFSLATVFTVQWAQAISRVAYSSLSKEQKNKSDFNHVFLRFNTTILFFILPIAIYVSHESARLVSILLGSKWQSAAELLSVLVWTGVGLSMFTIATTALRSLGKPSIELWLNVAFSIGLIIFIIAGALSENLYTLSIYISFWALLVALISICCTLYMIDVPVVLYFKFNKGVLVSAALFAVVINGFDDFLMPGNHGDSTWLHVLSILAISITIYILSFTAFERKDIAKLYSLFARRI